MSDSETVASLAGPSASLDPSGSAPPTHPTDPSTSADSEGESIGDDLYDDGLSMPFTAHLEELRTRILRCLGMVVVMAALSLAFARQIFWVLMAPVLEALPPGSQSLIYTSGIEELNVLLQVGLFAGLFLSVPLILGEVWKFIAPGLLKNEQRFLLPIITLGTAFFLTGALFCHQAVLPSMFSFLLSPGQTAEAMGPTIRRANLLLDDGLRLWTVGQDQGASGLAHQSLESLKETSTAHSDEAQKRAKEDASDMTAGELAQRFRRCDALLDAAVIRRGRTGPLTVSMDRHVQANEALASRDYAQAAFLLDQVMSATAEGFSKQSGQTLQKLWAANKAVASAEAELHRAIWTRPMLSMKEQLSLVLVLEIAFGLIFELPLIMGALAFLGLLKFTWVWRAHKYAIVGCVIASAVITPTGDIINLSLMAVPMILCFEVGVLMVFLLEKRRATD